MELFQQLNEERGITIVFVTHNPEVAAYCDRVVRVRDGLIESDERNPSAGSKAPQPHAAPGPPASR